MITNIAKIQTELDRLYAIDAKEREDGLPREKRLRAVHRDTGQFLYMFARACNANKILEIGTSHGVSTMWLGWAALENGGTITTIEIDSARAKAAAENFQKTGLDHIIQLHTIDAIQYLESCTDPFDLVFLDGEKTEYAAYLRLITPILSERGVILADNAITHVDKLTDYFKLLKTMGYYTITLQNGRGLEFSIKPEQP
jgi:predicted O-methyltransferase YrrM